MPDLIVVVGPPPSEEELRDLEKVKDITRTLLNAIPNGTRNDIALSAIATFLEIALHKLQCPTDQMCAFIEASSYRCGECSECRKASNHKDKD